MIGIIKIIFLNCYDLKGQFFIGGGPSVSPYIEDRKQIPLGNVQGFEATFQYSTRLSNRTAIPSKWSLTPGFAIGTFIKRETDKFDEGTPDESEFETASSAYLFTLNAVMGYDLYSSLKFQVTPVIGPALTYLNLLEVSELGNRSNAFSEFQPAVAVGLQFTYQINEKFRLRWLPVQFTITKVRSGETTSTFASNLLFSF